MISSSSASSSSFPSVPSVLVGGSLCSVSPCFSGDDKLLCVGNESSVKLYRASTGEQVGVLAGAPAFDDAVTSVVRNDGSMLGHSRTITAMFPHPTNRVQLYTAALDGTIKLWDLYDQTCVATYVIKIPGGEGEKFDRPPILHMVKGAADLLYVLVDPYMVHSTAATPASSTAQSLSSSAATASASATEPTERERACRIILYQLSKQTSFILYKVKDATRLAIDSSMHYLSAICGKTLRIYDTLGKKSKSSFKKSFPYNLHTVTFHPSEPYLTLGDEKGHILILYGYNSSVKGAELVTQTLHWHAHQVGAVLFTHDGHYMLSGGEEGVLVIWQLETGTKQFIPRLQSNILHMALSHDGNTYALCMGDNKIKLISAVSNRVERVIAGLTYSAPSHATGASSYLIQNPSAAGAASAGVTTRRITPTDDSTRTLAIPFLYSPFHQGWFLSSATPGAIQLYDIFTDRHLSEMDLLHRNIVSRTEDEASNQPRLESMALSPDGRKMVTTERRSGNVAAGANGVTSGGGSNTNDTIVMKFFEWNTHSASFVLNTRIDPPHSHASQHLTLSTLLWHPTEQMVVTIGKDACFKIWREIKKAKGPSLKQATQNGKHLQPKNGIEQEQEEDGDECYWNCTGVGHYRSYPTSSGAFSSDGSVLAVSYGQVLTLWDPFTLTLKHTLLHPSPSHPIRFVTFIPNTPFLLTTTSNAMYVWNLLTLALWWSYDLRVISYAMLDRKNEGEKNATGGHFAVMVLSPEEEDAKPPSPEEVAAAAAAAAADGSSPSTRSTPFKRRQTHLLLFSAHSPVPQRVWSVRDARLDSVSFPTSVAGSTSTAKSISAFTSPILFATDPALERAHKRSQASGVSHSSGAGSVPVSLIYVNYKRQLVRFDDIFGEQDTKREQQSASDADALALAKMQSQAEEISLFEQLYGKANKPVAPQSHANGASMKTNLVNGTAGATSGPSVAAGAGAVANLLNGPSHILPPPSTLFSSLMDGLLKKNIVTTTSNESSHHTSNAEEDVTMNDAEGEESEEKKAASVSLATIDSSLLSSESLPNGEMFAWDSHPALGARFSNLVALINSEDTKIHKEVQLSSGASASISDKKSKHASSDEKTSKSHKKSSKSPKLTAQAAASEPEAMEIDEEEAAPAAKSKKSSKASKNKH